MFTGDRVINGSVKSALWFRRTDQEVCPSADRMCRYLLRKHHRIGDIHLTQGCAGARGLRGAVAHRLGVWRRDLRPRLHVLRRTGRHHPEVWRRLFLRDGNLRRARGVNVCTRGIVISRYPSCKPVRVRLAHEAASKARGPVVRSSSSLQSDPRGFI